MKMYADFTTLNKVLNRLSILITVFITVNFAKIRAENCGPEEFARCSKPLQLLQSTDKICPDLTSGLACIRSFTRRCMNLQQRDHFNTLYNGTHQFVRDLCREGPYQEEFKRHAPCLDIVRSDYEVCAKTYQNTISEISQKSNYNDPESNYRNGDRRDGQIDVRTVCCSFLEYLDCSEQTARKTCGAETGRFTRGFLDKMSSSIKMSCEAYITGSDECPSFSSSSSLWRSLSTNLLLLITPTLSAIFAISQFNLR